ncbi:hypothetical protein [Croceicoccus mobilis]|uniref:Uncharacterized protein n=1 Tax=Croceicoccus mobilis TaxID=1703339 RepID=A0A916YU75_9SPHN|nr:hypothetical protein [Croceicoccus mobilis]GGD61702.1 hypothetical protein GCM10010990_08980 [Croceicoccus mobilis]
MERLAWKTARIVGHPDGDIWAAISAHHFEDAAGALDAMAGATALMEDALPAGGLVAEYLFCETLERAALVAEIDAMQARREFLQCSRMIETLQLAHAQIKAARHRYVSATMSALAKIGDAKARDAFRDFLDGYAFAAMQAQRGDNGAPLIISWEARHDS